MKKNINTFGRIFRFGIAIALMIYAYWQNSLLALLLALFTLYEAASSWCVMYQLLGKSSCSISREEEDKGSLDAKRLGLAGGILWGIFMCLSTLMDHSWLESLLTLVNHFILGFFALLLLAGLYNYLRNPLMKK